MADAPTVALIALLAAVGAAALAWWAARLRSTAALLAQRAEAEREHAAVAERLAAEQRRVSEGESRLRLAEEAREQTRSAYSDAQARIAQLETTLQHERRAAEEKLALLTDAHTRLAAEFKGLSADALKSNSTTFLELAQETFGRLQQLSAGELEKRQQAIDAVVKPLKESLEKVDAKIGEIENARARAYGQLGQQLEQLGAAQTRLQAEAARLSTALRSTSYAGSWGELQLRRVVELADMLPYVDFIEQQSAGALRADMVVRLPGGQQIVVDAKSPVQSYREAIDAADEPTRLARLADHAQKVRGHIDALGAKSYFENFRPAPEFVVLFMPGDHFLTAALQVDPSLLERGIARRVLLATPITLIALLKAAAYGWRQESVSQNAAEIAALGRQLYERMTVFAEHLEKVGRGLENAVKGFNAAVGSFEQSVLPSGRRFAELGARGAKELEAPGVVETAAREVAKRA